MNRLLKHRFFKKSALSKVVQLSELHTSKAMFLENEPPLQGVRILDLTRIVAGPYCSMILGDLGAEVIKIENLNTGDEARRWGPPFIGNTSESCYFVTFNRNKKSVCVNLKTDLGQNIISELAQKSDVLVENFVPGKLDQLNLGYEHLKVKAPHLIYCSITGYGSKGPYRTRPGYDVIAASIGGLLHITGPTDGEPAKVGVAMTDLATGLYAHGAIMAALLKRFRTGLGQKIDCNLLSTQISTLINIGSNYLNANKEAKRWGTAHESIVPYQAFKTKDGYFTVGTGSDKQFLDFCKRIGHPNLLQNNMYKTNKKRTENRKELILYLESVFITKTNLEWLKIFEGSLAPYGPINTIEQAFDDAQVKFMNLVREVKHPIAGTIKVVGPPVTYSEGGNDIYSPPPTLGQHTNEVLTGILKYNENDIRELRENNVIQ